METREYIKNEKQIEEYLVEINNHSRAIAICGVEVGFFVIFFISRINC